MTSKLFDKYISNKGKPSIISVIKKIIQTTTVHERHFK